MLEAEPIIDFLLTEGYSVSQCQLHFASLCYDVFLPLICKPYEQCNFLSEWPKIDYGEGYEFKLYYEEEELALNYQYSNPFILQKSHNLFCDIVENDDVPTKVCHRSTLDKYASLACLANLKHETAVH